MGRRRTLIAQQLHSRRVFVCPCASMQPAGRVCRSHSKHTFTNAPATPLALSRESGDQYTRSDMQPPCTLAWAQRLLQGDTLFRSSRNYSRSLLLGGVQQQQQPTKSSRSLRCPRQEFWARRRKIDDERAPVYCFSLSFFCAAGFLRAAERAAAGLESAAAALLNSLQRRNQRDKCKKFLQFLD